MGQCEVRMIFWLTFFFYAQNFLNILLNHHASNFFTISWLTLNHLYPYRRTGRICEVMNLSWHCYVSIQKNRPHTWVNWCICHIAANFVSIQKKRPHTWLNWFCYCLILLDSLDIANFVSTKKNRSMLEWLMYLSWHCCVMKKMDSISLFGNILYLLKYSYIAYITAVVCRQYFLAFSSQLESWRGREIREDLREDARRFNIMEEGGGERFVSEMVSTILNRIL